MADSEFHPGVWYKTRGDGRRRVIGFTMMGEIVVEDSLGLVSMRNADGDYLHDFHKQSPADLTTERWRELRTWEVTITALDFDNGMIVYRASSDKSLISSEAKTIARKTVTMVEGEGLEDQKCQP